MSEEKRDSDAQPSPEGKELLDRALFRWRDDPYLRLLGLEVVSCGPGHATVRLPVAEGVRNARSGPVHGGAVCSLIDIAIAVAVNATNATAGEGPIGQTTTDINVSFLAGATEGPLTAEARIIRRGRRLAVGDATVRDGKGEAVAVGRATFMLFRQSATDTERMNG